MLGWLGLVLGNAGLVGGFFLVLVASWLQLG